MEVVRLFLSPYGRIGRIKFWIVIITLSIIYVKLDNFSKSAHQIHYSILSIPKLVIIWPLTCALIKRFHDQDHTGYWSLLQSIPITYLLIYSMSPQIGQSLVGEIIGILAILSGFGGFITIWPCLFFAGDSVDNKYGSYNKKNQSNESSKEYYKSSSNLFISESDKHLISMLAKIAKCDGVVSQAEINVIDNFFTEILKLSDQERNEYIKIFSNAKTSSISFDYHCKEYCKLNKFNNDLLKGVLELCVLVAFADEKLSAEEDFLINEIIEIFGIESQTYNSYKQNYNNYQTSETDKTEEYHLSVLGLDETASFDDIKNAYRRLANQYHPDKVAHLGDKLKEVAAEEMKKINEAYEYLKNNRNN